MSQPTPYVAKELAEIFQRNLQGAINKKSGSFNSQGASPGDKFKRFCSENLFSVKLADPQESLKLADERQAYFHKAYDEFSGKEEAGLVETRNKIFNIYDLSTNQAFERYVYRCFQLAIKELFIFTNEEIIVRPELLKIFDVLDFSRLDEKKQEQEKKNLQLYKKKFNDELDDTIRYQLVERFIFAFASPMLGQQIGKEGDTAAGQMNFFNEIVLKILEQYREKGIDQAKPFVQFYELFTNDDLVPAQDAVLKIINSHQKKVNKQPSGEMQTPALSGHALRKAGVAPKIENYLKTKDQSFNLGTLPKGSLLTPRAAPSTGTPQQSTMKDIYYKGEDKQELIEDNEDPQNTLKELEDHIFDAHRQFLSQGPSSSSNDLDGVEAKKNFEQQAHAKYQELLDNIIADKESIKNSTITTYFSERRCKIHTQKAQAILLALEFNKNNQSDFTAQEFLAALKIKFPKFDSAWWSSTTGSLLKEQFNSKLKSKFSKERISIASNWIDANFQTTNKNLEEDLNKKRESAQSGRDVILFLPDQSDTNLDSLSNSSNLPANTV